MNFSYQAKNKEGKLLEGEVDAPNEASAVETLQAKGYIILSLNPSKTGVFEVDLGSFLSKPNNKDVVIFTRQLATLVDAGMPLAEGLRTLAKQTEKPVFQKIISEISDSVEGGSSLSSALSEYPKLFSEFYVKLVRSGELSGKLHDVLTYLAEYLERTQAVISKIRGALAYPIFIVIAMIIVVFIMALFVLPNLLAIFDEMGVEELPITTEVLIVFTDFINAYIYVLLFLGIAAMVAFMWYVKTEQGRVWFDNMKLKIPIFGGILRDLYISRMAESLATLIKSDIAILDVIKITADIVGNTNYKKVLLSAEESVRGGGSMSEVFAEHKEVPPLMTSMISVGERTGKIEFMLNHVSRFFREKSESNIQNISQLIEPILVFILGIGVALMVSSVLLPIYSLVGSAG